MFFRTAIFSRSRFFRIPGSVEELPMSRVNFLRGFFGERHIAFPYQMKVFRIDFFFVSVFRICFSESFSCTYFSYMFFVLVFRISFFSYIFSV